VEDNGVLEDEQRGLRRNGSAIDKTSCVCSIIEARKSIDRFIYFGIWKAYIANYTIYRQIYIYTL